MASVFVSYAHDDAGFVDPIVDTVKKMGHDVNIDTELLIGGDRLVPKIKQNIEDSDFIIVFLSSNSVKSKWVSREIFEALRIEIETKKGRMIPCKIGDTDDSVFPEAFTKHPAYERPYIDFTRKATQDAIVDLCSRLEEGQPSEIVTDDFMTLNIEERGLDIYLTDVVGQKNSQLRYAEMLESYLLFGFRRDAIGPYFKHFVVCDKANVPRQTQIKNILKSAGYAATGDGSDDDEPGKWRIWFLRRDCPATRGYDDASSNNIWCD